MEKIGIGIVTFNRQEMFKKTLKSVIDNLPIDYEYEICVVNDGSYYTSSTYLDNSQIHFIQHSENKGVGEAKNSAVKYLMGAKAGYCNHIFLIEDDILVKSPEVWNKYIDAARKSHLSHLMFALHGPACKKDGKPNPRAIIINFSPEINLALYPNCVGAFTYYTREILLKVGLFKSEYKNAVEHLEHTYCISKLGETTPWWWFADIAESWKYLDEQACSEVNSVIRPRADWQENVRKGWNIFKENYGYYPTEIPDTSLENVTKFLRHKLDRK